MPRSRADENRKIRQEALREQLANQGHVQHAVDLIDKIESAEDSFEVQKYKAAFDSRMRLVAKYVPDLKASEITGEGGEPLPTSVTLKHVKPGSFDT
jgi:hypothetical protein